MKTEHAKAAKAIKKELSEKFPATKFSVKSDGFSMGNAVRINWVDGPTRAQVEEITNKYQCGHFNGMDDCYYYDNRQPNISQTKYVTCNRKMSDTTKDNIVTNIILPKYGQIADNGFDENKFYEEFKCWGSTLVYREFSNMAL